MTLFSAAGQIAPKAPFDFVKSLDFLGGFSPVSGEQAIGPASLTKAVFVQGQLVVFKVTLANGAGLDYALYSDQPISPGKGLCPRCPAAPRR